MQQATDKKTDEKEKKKHLKDYVDEEEYILRKRLPRKLPKRNCDIYVTRKTDFRMQLARCQKLLDNGNDVFVHGLGAAINRAINLALQLKARGLGTIEIGTHTSTVELVDDLEPQNDELDHETFTRNNSAVHIRVFRQQSLRSGDSEGPVQRTEASEDLNIN
ncbi:hypothetical protein CHS0354_004355 [Potamilus streckersoni]|uniref:Ribonuclease P protein subunit p20 n=1 Tax=Potamilus streckersoni TaxID=2493646 RepID=A0AAE0SFX4_9BIVA|nr:hypothetical protein CHS0354_004355 [Potamilus streckersoni]